MIVEELLDRWEALRESGQSISAEELCLSCPEHLPEVRRRILQLAALDDFIYEPPEVVMPNFACRYEPIRFHAAGGLGEVYVARDKELQREVAFKRIKANVAQFGESQQRFLREAEITARLEHPGVAPVYGCGVDAEGRPYYAMRFIRGETLKVAIERLHRAKGESPQDSSAKVSSAEPPTLAKLLRTFVQICQTMEFAHRHGVVHRDLKPGNVLLGPYGETLVVDWGLARMEQAFDASLATDQPAVESASSISDSSSDSSSDETVDYHRQAVALRTLGIKGSPAYMSPEQADGDWDRVGPLSDVYSLGATLYEILTGKAPVLGKNSREVLAKVRAGDFPRPRAIRPHVPQPLEAICLRAMQLAPEQRYSSAAAMAQDVDAWLDGEPVSAWQEPWTWRAQRWLRKHRTIATSLASTAAVAFVLLLVMTISLTAANRREKAALSQAHFSLATTLVFLIDMTSTADRRDNVDFQRAMTTTASGYRRLLELDPQNFALQEELAMAEVLRADSAPAPITSPATAAMYQTAFDELQKVQRSNRAPAQAARDFVEVWSAIAYASRSQRWLAVGDKAKSAADFDLAEAGIRMRRPLSSAEALLLANFTLEDDRSNAGKITDMQVRLDRIDQALASLATFHDAGNAIDRTDAVAKLKFNRIMLQAQQLERAERHRRFEELATECQKVTPATAVTTTVAARCLRMIASQTNLLEERWKLLDQAEALLKQPLQAPADKDAVAERLDELGALQASYLFSANQIVFTESEADRELRQKIADRVLQILDEKTAAEPRGKYLRQLLPMETPESLREHWTKQRQM